MAPLIPDEKCLVLQHEDFSLSISNTAGYHLGPVVPSATDPAPLEQRVLFLWKTARSWIEPTSFWNRAPEQTFEQTKNLQSETRTSFLLFIFLGLFWGYFCPKFTTNECYNFPRAAQGLRGIGSINIGVVSLPNVFKFHAKKRFELVFCILWRKYSRKVLNLSPSFIITGFIIGHKINFQSEVIMEM